MSALLLLAAIWAAPAWAECPGGVCPIPGSAEEIPAFRQATQFGPSSTCSGPSCGARGSSPTGTPSPGGSSPCGNRGGCPSSSFQASAGAPPSPGCSSCGGSAQASGDGAAAANGGGSSCGGDKKGGGGGGPIMSFFQAIGNFFRGLFGGR